jgi:hypothetical protein
MVVVARLRSLLLARFARVYRRPRRLGLALVSRFARLMLAALAGFSFARLTAHSQPPDLGEEGSPLQTSEPILRQEGRLPSEWRKVKGNGDHSLRSGLA